MTLSREQQRELIAYLNQYGTPEHAAYQAGIQLRAIAPYTDGQTARVRAALLKLAEFNPEARTRITLRISQACGLTWTPSESRPE